MEASAVHAQTVNGTPNFNEIFKQKKTQRRYSLKQIALLQTYYQFLKKGYEVAQKGLNLIGTIKDANFQQHQNYFASLKSVKPGIRNYSRIQLTLSQYNNVQVALDRILSGPYREAFAAHEWQEVTQACDLLREESISIRDDLMLVVAAGELQMTDDERLERIDRLNKEMSSTYTHAAEFSSSIESLWRARAKARKEDVYLMETLNGLDI
jgi:hypothetical protein